MVLLTTTCNACRQIEHATELVSVAGLRAYLMPNPPIRPDCTYTDGRKIGFPPDGCIAVCGVPGAPNSYNTEVIGVLPGSTLSSPHTTLRVDCKRAIASKGGTRRPVRHSHWVLLARDSLLRRHHTLEWIEGHTGHVHQESSDEYSFFTELSSLSLTQNEIIILSNIQLISTLTHRLIYNSLPQDKLDKLDSPIWTHISKSGKLSYCTPNKAKCFSNASFGLNITKGSITRCFQTINQILRYSFRNRPKPQISQSITLLSVTPVNPICFNT